MATQEARWAAEGRPEGARGCVDVRLRRVGANGRPRSPQTTDGRSGTSSEALELRRLFPLPAPSRGIDMRLRRVAGAPPLDPGVWGGATARTLGRSHCPGVWGAATARGLGRSPSCGKGRGGEQPAAGAKTRRAPLGGPTGSRQSYRQSYR
ncbi:hypothetical protein GCM10022420_056260 [Streptomyces iranensis]